MCVLEYLASDQGEAAHWMPRGKATISKPAGSLQFGNPDPRDCSQNFPLLVGLVVGRLAAAIRWHGTSSSTSVSPTVAQWVRRIGTARSLKWFITPLSRWKLDNVIEKDTPAVLACFRIFPRERRWLAVWVWVCSASDRTALRYTHTPTHSYINISGSSPSHAQTSVTFFIRRQLTRKRCTLRGVPGEQFACHEGWREILVRGGWNHKAIKFRTWQLERNEEMALAWS